MERKFNKQPKLHIRTGDTVKVLAGDDKGKTGKVLSVNREKKRAIVEGLNMVTKHIKPSATNPQGGIEKKEAGIHISNLMLVDPKTGDATRTGRKAGENGKLVRYSKKTGEVING
ncbi:50S ribosomal protein L24 [Litoribacter populi]|uniref:50S ribosomal protein L24 n=1 Tax=Litoribacter populi TaxID=2598460 RepID=UPI00117EC689|nr:50S ribosomal protein L24 [Litoribacter populi]